MPDPDYGKITDEKLAQLRERVGVEVDPENFVPPDEILAANWRPMHTGFNREVTADGVRHFVNGYGDDNPLYCDPEYAAKSSWGGLTGPPLFVWSMFLNPFSAQSDPAEMTLGGGDEAPRRLKPEVRSMMEGDPLRGVGALQSKLEYSFFRPLRLGDEVFTKKALLGLQDKRSSWGGRAIHVIWGLVSWNQRRELIHFQKGTWIRAERQQVSEVKQVQQAADPYTDEQLAEIDAAYEAESRRGGQVRYWEDVEVGDSLQERVKGPLRLTEVILWHAGWGQGFPTRAHRLAYETRKATPGLFTRDTRNVPDIVQRMHWDLDWAQRVGAAERYDYGTMRETWLSQLALDWAGDDAWTTSMSIEHRKFNMVGDTSWLRGSVISKAAIEGRHEVTLDVRIDNQRAITTSRGTINVVLPSRNHGSISLPRPAVDDPLELLRHEIARLAG